jgi:hypothetical protein
MVLLADWGWVRRRSETAEFQSREVVRLTSTIDLEVPADLFDRLTIRPDARPRVTVDTRKSRPLSAFIDRFAIRPAMSPQVIEGKRRILLPLDVLPKGPLANFDLTLDGRSITMLHSREGAAITTHMLAAIAYVADGYVASPEIRRTLGVVTGIDVREAKRALADLRAVPGVPLSLVRAAEPFVEQFLLLAQLTTDQPELLIKYGRDLPVRDRAASADGQYRMTRRQRVGLRAMPLIVPLPSSSLGASYHVEAIVPEELKIVWTRLEDAETLAALDQQHLVDRASLYTRSVRAGHVCVLRVAVLTQRPVFLVPAALIAGLSAAALLIGGVVAAFGGLGSNVPGAAGGAVLLGPSIAASLVLAREDAALTRVLLHSPRSLLAIVTFLAFLGGAAFAFGLRDVEVGVVWLVLGLMAAAGAGILTAAARKAIAEAV